MGTLQNAGKAHSITSMFSEDANSEALRHWYEIGQRNRGVKLNHRVRLSFEVEQVKGLGKEESSMC